MKTEQKIADHFKRDHLVTLDFTVSTYGAHKWKVSAEVRSNDELLTFEFIEDDIEMYMKSHDKGAFLHRNLPSKFHQLIYSWLSDFPRWHVINGSTKEVLAQFHTYSNAEDDAHLRFYTFEEIRIIDTWRL